MQSLMNPEPVRVNRPAQGRGCAYRNFRGRLPILLFLGLAAVSIGADGLAICSADTNFVLKIKGVIQLDSRTFIDGNKAFEGRLFLNIRVLTSDSHTTFNGGGGRGTTPPATVTEQAENVFFTRVQLSF